MKIKKTFLIILIIIIVLALVYAVYNKFLGDKTSDGQLSDKKVASLTKKVSKLINVPDEKPVIATILKADELIAEQKFYTGSQNGDFVLIFPTAQKAIIYRESDDKLINVGPIIVDQAQQTKQDSIKKEEVKATTTATTTKDKKN